MIVGVICCKMGIIDDYTKQLSIIAGDVCDANDLIGDSSSIVIVMTDKMSSLSLKMIKEICQQGLSDAPRTYIRYKSLDCNCLGDVMVGNYSYNFSALANFAKKYIINIVK